MKSSAYSSVSIPTKMKNSIAFLLTLALLAGCISIPSKKKKEEKAKEKALDWIQQNRQQASMALEEAIKEFPELDSAITIVKHDTVVRDSIVIKKVYEKTPVLDTAGMVRFQEKLLNVYDSLNLLVADRDTRNKILNRKVMSLAVESGILNRDTMRIDTAFQIRQEEIAFSIGVSLKTWIYKGRIYSELRQTESMILAVKSQKHFIRPDCPPKPEFWEYWEAWLLAAVILLLTIALFYK
jgi:hypothetical protein